MKSTFNPQNSFYTSISQQLKHYKKVVTKEAIRKATSTYVDDNKELFEKEIEDISSYVGLMQIDGVSEDFISS